MRPGRAAAPLDTLKDCNTAGGVAGQGATVGPTPGVPVCDLGGAFVTGVCVYVGSPMGKGGVRAGSPCGLWGDGMQGTVCSTDEELAMMALLKCVDAY